MINSIYVFNTSVMLLDDDLHLDVINKNARAITVKLLNEYIQRNKKIFELALKKDIEQYHFPITIRYEFMIEEHLSEFMSLQIVDRHANFFIKPQIFLRHLVKKYNQQYDYKYITDYQFTFNQYLQNLEFDIEKDGKSLIFQKHYDNVLIFDNDLKNFVTLLRDTFENVDKTMFIK